MPLLLRLILGMPLILIVPVVGMSQITSTQILGLTKPNYNAPRISSSRYETSHRLLKSSQIKSYHTRQSNCNTLPAEVWVHQQSCHVCADVAISYAFSEYCCMATVVHTDPAATCMGAKFQLLQQHSPE